MEDLTLSIHIHTIDRIRHREFLNERRKDPFTKKELKVGDRIVFCAGCKSAFLLDSWKGMGNKHCKQTETLAEFPSYKSRFVDPKLKAEVESLRIRNQELEAEVESLRIRNQELETEVELLRIRNQELEVKGLKPRIRKSKNLES